MIPCRHSGELPQEFSVIVFCADAYGGSMDGAIVQRPSVPRDGDEHAFGDGSIYVFSWRGMRWNYAGHRKPAKAATPRKSGE